MEEQTKQQYLTQFIFIRRKAKEDKSNQLALILSKMGLSMIKYEVLTNLCIVQSYLSQKLASQDYSFQDKQTVIYNGENYFPSVLIEPILKKNRIYTFEFQYTAYLKSLFKIGVCKRSFQDYDSCFSDSTDGWTYYISEGQLRHNSNGSGDYYGIAVRSGNYKIKMIINTVQGSISYEIDDQNFGVAFNNIKEIKEGNAYAGFCCFSQGNIISLLKTTVKYIHSQINI